MEENQDIKYDIHSEEYGNYLRAKYGNRSSEYITWYTNMHQTKYSLYDMKGLRESFIKEYGNNNRESGIRKFAIADALYSLAVESTFLNSTDFPIIEVKFIPAIEEIIKQYPDIANFVASMCSEYGIVPDMFKDLSNAQGAGLSVKKHMEFIKTGDPGKLVFDEEQSL